MFAYRVTTGLAKKIIDDSCLLIFILASLFEIVISLKSLKCLSLLPTNHMPCTSEYFSVSYEQVNNPPPEIPENKNECTIYINCVLCVSNKLQKSSLLAIDPRGLPQSRPVVITIFTHVVRPSVRPSVRPYSRDNHCRPGLWAGQVDHWWLVSCSLLYQRC